MLIPAKKSGNYRLQYSPGALRLWFKFEALDVQLVRLSALDLRPPPSDPLGDPTKTESLNGAWVELRNEAGRALWRRILHNPFGRWVEAPNPDGGFTNVVVDSPRGSFTVLVPDLMEAHTVALFASLDDAGIPREGAAQIAEFPLRRKR